MAMRRVRWTKVEKFSTEPKDGAWVLCRVPEPCTILSIREQVVQSAGIPAVAELRLFLPAYQAYEDLAAVEAIPSGLLSVKALQTSTSGVSCNYCAAPASYFSDHASMAVQRSSQHDS